MNLRAAIVLTFCITGPLLAQNVPTPAMAVAFEMGQDTTTKWELAYANGNSTGSIAEMVPEGQTINAWKEMVAQQTTLTEASLATHLEGWEAMVRRADPAVEIEVRSRTDESVTVVYSSRAFNEYSIRRFFKGPDGIYVLAYHIRLALMDEARAATWRKIIAESKLMPNPVEPEG